MGAFPSSLYGDSAFGSGIDYGMGNSTIAPQLISSSGTQARMSPFLQSTIDLYDPNAPWPNSSTGVGGSLEQPSQNRSNSNTLYSSPSASSFNLNDSVDPLALSTSSVALSKSSALTSNLDFRGSLRSMTDPNCITATEQGRRYLYVL